MTKPHRRYQNSPSVSHLLSYSPGNRGAIIKAAPWDDINFRFFFRPEVVYPTDHVFIFFRIFIFLQIFLINISIKPEVTQTNSLYT